MEFLKLESHLLQKYPDLKIYPLNVDDIIFEERVKQKCFHCKNYKEKWTCPGNLPLIDYKKLVREYDHAAVICNAMSINNNFEEIRTKSTNELHRALLYLEKYLYQHNFTLAISFIGGSCKLCKNGCNKDKCANPYMSRTPWEGTGCNVVKTLEKIGISVVFPQKDILYRYGLILW